jgi:23S rRNA (pseudouridine1915-N3)-methyltransferase
MEIAIVAIGRLKRGPIADLVADYTTRLPWPVAIHEIDAINRKNAAETVRVEAERLRAQLPKTGRVVALDSGGRQLGSEAFAKQLGSWRDGGAPRVAFVIGGAEGLERRLIEEADLALSLGAMTWPHLLVRAMLAEQLFRAASLLAGHPYHRGRSP